MSASKWVYRFRGYFIPPPLIFAFLCFRYETEAEFIWPIGIGLLLFGVVLRIWAQQHLHYRLKVHKRLTMTGPYSFVRNPIYIGNLLICLGATVLSELLWLVPITLVYGSGVYSLVVRYEESHLLSKYGEPYRKYMTEVPRWFPKGIKVSTFRSLGLKNEYFQPSIAIEIHCFLLLLPYILKELVSPWFEH
jgi:protein-S-isoprenylcysteine O-methyltransferase Ste14